MSRVRVTSRRTPHKVERVSGLVTRSNVDMPKVSKAKQYRSFLRVSCTLSPVILIRAS